ncbi:hypothetical protein D3C72_2224710 [compost metagenome]
MFIAPDTKVTGSDTTVSLDSQRFGKNQCCLTQSTSTIMNAVPVSDKAVIRRHVHAHRGHDDPVFQFKAFNFMGG